MKRREFIVGLGGVAAWPVAAQAQQRAAVPVIGYLGARNAAADAAYVEAFRKGLVENGFVPGQNVAIEYSWADGRYNELPTIATELVRRRVNLIVCAGSDAAPLAAKAATTTIPILFSAGGDPVKNGLVSSLNRPDGNLTGVTTLIRDLNAKRLGLLVDVAPKVTTIAYLIAPAGASDSDSQTVEVQEAARAIRRELLVLNVHSERDIEGSFATMMQHGSGALLVGPGVLWRGLVTALATRRGLPALYPVREFTTIGGLMSYGASFTAMYYQVGIYAGRILKGANPAELPVVQPTKFEFVINLNTAKALGLTIPETLLATADEVIQ
jgi:putative ABC transport system substrate-binding protein